MEEHVPYFEFVIILSNQELLLFNSEWMVCVRNWQSYKLMFLLAF